MKIAMEHKKERLTRLVPEFLGYQGHHYAKTDFLLRRRLAEEVDRSRDRLAGFLAAGRFPPDLRESLAATLRTAAFLKEELSPRAEEVTEGTGSDPRAEEALFDLDLALLDRVAGLRALLDVLEASGEEDLAAALSALDEGLAEVDDLFRRRQAIFGETVGGG